MVRLLSDTEQGKAWISNFETADQHLAIKLLDQLRIIDSDTMHFHLESLLKSLINENHIQKPILFVNALSHEDMEKVHPGQRVFEIFQNCFPNDFLSSNPGSEAPMARFIRDFIRAAPTEEVKQKLWISPSQISSKKQLHDLKCRTIAILTDFCSSGQQLLEYAKCWVRNSTIRSWRSSQYIRIVGVSFAYSKSAYEKARLRHSPVDALYGYNVMPTFDTCGWTAQEQDEIRSFCNKYTPNRFKQQSLGYHNSQSLFVVIPAISNNLPWVLRPVGNKKDGSEWIPFFRGRTYPEELWNEIPSYGALPAPEEILGDEFEGYLRILNSINRTSRKKGNQLLVVMALVRAGFSSAEELAARTGFPMVDIKSLLQTLRRLGLLSNDNQFTNLGLREYKNWLRMSNIDKRNSRSHFSPVEMSFDFYYPQKLR